jgi:N,N'-diacetylchitobiose phosphorylase
MLRSAPDVSQQTLPSQPCMLSNGTYHVRLSEVGSGYSELGGVAVTRWGGDETRDADGFYIYIRDLENGHVWSAGYQPTRVRPANYVLRRSSNRFEITRRDYEIESLLTVSVAQQHNFEVRTCRLTNLGPQKRRLELTSYAEWVLGSQDGDRHHPAFSKLFVETQYCAELQAILARRRPRHSDDREFWGFHSVLRAGNVIRPDELQFETNRSLFIGRGRTLRLPIALEPGMSLKGDFGAVLDPIASIRVVIDLEPGESQEVSYILGAASESSDIDKLLAAARSGGQTSVPRPKAIPVLATNGVPSERSAPAFIHCADEETYKPDIAAKNCDECDAQFAASADRTPLLFDNGYGGFSADGREYIVRLRPDGKGHFQWPPMPWANVIANEQAGFLVTEKGAGYTWSGNSRTNRLTAWHNDPICDCHAEAVWLRDEDRNLFWSLTPGPTPASSEYEVRHGFGYTVFHHSSHELSQELTMFMARDEPVKLAHVRIVNLSGRKRRLSLFSCLQWALGGLPVETNDTIAMSYDKDPRVIWARNPNREIYGKCVAFSAAAPEKTNRCEIFHTSDRMTFVGRYGDLDSPKAIVSADSLDCQMGENVDPCAAWQLRFELSAGDSFECTFLLGETFDVEEASRLVCKYSNASQVQQALADARNFWLNLLSAVTIETPDKEIDLMVNGWLTYQNLSCRMWGRSAYYQPGGAFGFRDQLQDSAALVYFSPTTTRAQILRHASQQFIEGDVLHWWHPDNGYGVRTRFSDDLLWLPCITAEYMARTGDESILDEELPFICAPALAPGQQEAYLRPEPAGVSASLYEHCCRALNRGLTCGPHGLPLIGCGDWNDGFSRVGRNGVGESIWLGFFIAYVIERMLPLCSSRGDQERVASFGDYRKRLLEALNSAGWDGRWYRRAYYDNGQPIGSAESDECQIDALAQAWAVISGITSPERAKMAISAMEDRLVDDDAGLIRLLTPAFNSTPNDPGYIKGYLPGIRENGGQYTHGVLWAVRALAELGRGTRAVELLRMLTPVWHSKTKERADIYKTEPYVVAADVYGEPPHVGRGGWTWYTGSAGWMFRVAVESVFGVSIEKGSTLTVNPSISSKWPRCRMVYRIPDRNTTYDIVIENPDGKEHGVSMATIDGQLAQVVDCIARVPLVDDGELHHVVIRL